MKPTTETNLHSCCCPINRNCLQNMSFDSSISSAPVAVSQDSKVEKVREVSSDQIDELENTALGSEKSATPPVGEIQIPTPSSDVIEAALKESGTYSAGLVDTVDYKTLYFCGQRDLFEVQQRFEYVCEDNRLLKRKIFELEKQLYHNSRTRRRIVHANSAWSIPGEAPQTPIKTSQSFLMTQNGIERHVTVSPGAESRCNVKRVSIAGDSSSKC